VRRRLIEAVLHQGQFFKLRRLSVRDDLKPQPGLEVSWAAHPIKGGAVNLGNFCISLAVTDLAASRAFYEKFGFAQVGGDATKGWLVLKNGDTKIGLFQGMFEKNMLTFNPGWDSSARPLAEYTDVREIQRQLLAQGIALDARADETTTGPAYIMATDPDGNPILIDQHV